MLKRSIAPRKVILLLLALLVLAAGCGPGPAQPTATPTEVAVEVPDDVRLARDAALAYVSEKYGDQAPAPGLTWAEEYITPEGLVGWVTYEFRAEEWVVTIGAAVVPPEMRRYEVAVDNPTTGFWWEGRVDAEGQVVEGPEMVLTVLDASLAYISEYYPDQAPATDLAWEGGRTTLEGLVGSETFQYTGDDWVVTISYPVVAPENVIYHIVAENPTTGFRWEGGLDAEQYLTETAPPTEGDFQPLSAAACNDLADGMAQTLGVEVVTAQAPFEDYINRKTGRGCQITATGTGLDFESFRTVDEDLFWTIFEHLKAMLTAQGWQEVTIYQADAPVGTGTGFRKEHGLCLLLVGWEPSEDADCPADQPIYECELTPEQQIYTIVLSCAEAVPIAGQPVVCWYGHVVSLPDGAQFDDYLVLEPEGAGEIGLEGANAEIEAEIEGLRDKEEPGGYAHFWGTLTCPVLDYGGCQLLVTRLRPEGPEGPFFDPDPVEGWEGTLVSNPPGAQFDDYFVLAGDFSVGYGIDSSDPTIASQLESLRDTGTTIRVWGQVTCPAIDSYGTHILVTRIEVEEEAPATGQPLTLEALKNAAYFSEWPADGVAQLVDGEYEEEIVPGAASKLTIVFYPDMYAFGDLDGDGVEDAAVVLATSGGGSGTFISLEAVINDQGTPKHVATAFLGDRAEMKSISIESGKITVDMVTHGPDDPMCCPTLEVIQKYELQGDQLVELSNGG